MNLTALDWSILWPACAAGLLIAVSHVPLGMQVLERGIVFIDLAIAQIAGAGVVLAHTLGFEAQGWAVQCFALAAALAGAGLLTWTERGLADVQEAVIGVTFILAASGTTLLLAQSPKGAEHLKELLVGQILWVTPDQLLAAAMAYLLLLPCVVMTRARRSGALFYAVFAMAVTVSVQLVGLYLVFTTLIVPALATRAMRRSRLAAAYGLCGAGYAAGIVLSALTDLPTGPTVVWVMTSVAAIVFVVHHQFSLGARGTKRGIV